MHRLLAVIVVVLILFFIWLYVDPVTVSRFSAVQTNVDKVYPVPTYPLKYVPDHPSQPPLVSWAPAYIPPIQPKVAQLL